MEEEKRPSPILSSPLLDPTRLSAAHQPTGFPPGKQNTVSSATLNGRWYLQVPAAWGRAVLLPSSSTAEPSPAAHRSKRDQFTDGSTEIQPRHPLPLSISCPKPGCCSQFLQQHVRPSPPRSACHDEWRSSPPAVWHADPEVPVANPPLSSHTAAASSCPPHTSHPQPHSSTQFPRRRTSHYDHFSFQLDSSAERSTDRGG